MKQPTKGLYAEFNELKRQLERIKAEIRSIKRQALNHNRKGDRHEDNHKQDRH